MKPPETFNLFATAPKGIEPVLAEELQALGVTTAKPGRGGVAFQGTLAMAYRVCLWTRTANRVLLQLGSFTAADPAALYQGVQTIPWVEHLTPDTTLAVDFEASVAWINHTLFGAQKVKDAIVDYARDRWGRRPSVDRHHPDLRINCYVRNDRVTLSLDLSGDSLHRRGYREETVIAPLKENLAAALLLKAGWPALAAGGGGLVDPLCGSGTLVIEAAWMAADRAPGLSREHWGFLGWGQHDPVLWVEILDEARQRFRVGLEKSLPLAGYDQDPQAIRAAVANAERAGVRHRVQLECRPLAAAEPPPAAMPGLLITNPPYGERLGTQAEWQTLYAQLGDLLKARFQGWQAAIFTGNPELGKCMGLRARRMNTFYNGALECKLLRFTVAAEYVVERNRVRDQPPPSATTDPGAAMFANRLRKNLRTLGRWAQRQGITCYRLYDADMPEYNVAVDLYEEWVHVQEYQAPSSVDPAKAQIHLQQIKAVLPLVLEVPQERIFYKTRQPQKGLNQYQKLADGGRFHEIGEGRCRFLVNFSDHLDTGLFLDHRLTRRLIGEWAQGRRFLNLFAYTGSATVYAALGGAKSTTTVDMSPTYLNWALRNLALNGINDRRHHLVQADCLRWLDETDASFDLIFLDPPTFSNSKRMPAELDVQRDHVALIHKTMRLLDKDGVLIFSTNHQRFKMNGESLADFHLVDISRRTLPEDFKRNPKIHQCWLISWKPLQLQTALLAEERKPT